LQRALRDFLPIEASRSILVKLQSSVAGQKFVQSATLTKEEFKAKRILSSQQKNSGKL